MPTVMYARLQLQSVVQELAYAFSSRPFGLFRFPHLEVHALSGWQASCICHACCASGSSRVFKPLDLHADLQALLNLRHNKETFH